MRKALRHVLAVGLSGAFACLAACSKLDTPKPTPASVDATSTSAAVAKAQQWYVYGRKSANGQKNATAQRSLQEVVPRSVAIDWHAAVTDHEYVIAPLVDNNNPFADANKFGYRYLVVRQLNESDYDGRLVEFVVSGHPQSPTEAATTALNGARPYLLGHGPGFISGFTGWFLT